jgi:hypothetical protein
VVRRFVMLVLSFCLVLSVGIMQVDQSFAQGEAKKATQPPKSGTAEKETVKKDLTPTKTTKEVEATTKEAPPAAERPIPPEVQAKLDAARKAVAEAIVAAQDAGLVETSIDPPPILDILINGRATDARTLKNTPKKPYAVSPEVFCAWFTGYGKLEGIDYVHDVRITQPSAGLKQWYDQRAAILRHYIDEIRKARGQSATPPREEGKPAESKKGEAPAKSESVKKQGEEVKKK